MERLRFTAHARSRMAERGVKAEEAAGAIEGGERFPARLGRTGFRRNYPFGAVRRGRRFDTKQVEVLAVEEAGAWVVITVLTRYF